MKDDHIINILTNLILYTFLLQRLGECTVSVLMNLGEKGL